MRRVSDALKVAIPVVTLSFLTDWLRTGQRPDHMRYSSVPEDVMLAQCPRRTANLQHLAHDVKHRLLQWLGDLERVQLRATCRSWLKVQCSAATKILIKSKLSKKRIGRVRDLYAKVERVHGTAFAFRAVHGLCWVGHASGSCGMTLVRVGWFCVRLLQCAQARASRRR